MDPTVNNYVTVPSAVNLFVAAVCWLVCLFFLLFGRTALIGGVKERKYEVQVSDMLLLLSIRIDFHCPLVAVLTGFHRSLFCNCCRCGFFVIAQLFFLMDEQGGKALSSHQNFSVEYDNASVK